MDAPDVLSPALEAALMRFGALIRQVGWRHGLSEAEIDELMQSIRLRLWQARGSREMIESIPASYLYKTAVTASLDLIRRRRDSRHTPLDDSLAVGHDSGARAEHSDLVDHVAAALDGLTRSRRPVVRMYLAGYDQKEIAGLMGWTEPKTRNLLYRGLAELREALSARGFGPSPGRRP